ncbi:MAG: HD domain-containing protein [Bacteroidales bacterium]|nr:HD domain-containing protein [Candidatus Cryptobacteroides aphodequi]
MANKPLDTAFVDKAIRFAVDAHAGTERRGKGFPYVIHVLEAMEIVSTITSDPELLAAAALHDTVEDTDVTIEQIRSEFGPRVAALVDSESEAPLDASVDESLTWRDRKRAAIERLGAASHDAKIVALGDKLSNMRAIARDYRKKGDALWTIFHAPGGRADHEWHYRGLAASLSDLAGTDAYAEFTAHITEVFGEPKPESIDMAEYEESGDGFTAISYNHCGGERMIKLYHSFMPAEVPEKELHYTWNIMSLGLNIPKAYGLVTDGSRVGVEFQRISPKKSFARAISEDWEGMETYIERFAAMCRDLHSRRCDVTRFDSNSDHFRAVVAGSKYLSEEDKAKATAFIDSLPESEVCSHGDLHPGNAIFNTDTGEEFWIDLSDFRYGNPILDLGMFYMCAHFCPDELTQRLFHIGNEQIIKVWDCFEKKYFGLDADFETIHAQLAASACLYLVGFADRDGLEPWMRTLFDQYLLK